MAYFTEKFVNRKRKKWIDSIKAVEAQSDGKWYRGDISKKEVIGNSLVIEATFPVLDAMACTITATQLIDVYGEQAAYQQKIINKNSGQGIMVKITIPIYEVTA